MDASILLPEFNRPVSALAGIGPGRERLLAEVGVFTMADLLLFAPVRYVDRNREASIAEMPVGQEATVVGRVAGLGTVPGRRKRFRVTIEDASGKLECIWFAGYSHLPRMLAPGAWVSVGGTVSLFEKRRQMVHPELDLLTGGDGEARLHTGRIIPMYRTSRQMKAAKMGTRFVRRTIHKALEAVCNDLQDSLPSDLRDRYGLMEFRKAIRKIHFPEAMEEVEDARHRLAFDELFGLQLHMLRLWDRQGSRTAPALPGQIGPATRALIASLPFRLTGAQERALEEIRKDMATPGAMLRLLQGDVGSGKTLVAALAMTTVVDAGAQAALLVPTELLARQHADTLRELLRPVGLSVELLTGAASREARGSVLNRLSSGAVSLVVGTHALLERDVAFKNLGLAVVDEQHRFGVLQRAVLRQKGEGVHLLAMTATPIPRSLALTVYGDLEVTVLDELPRGRRQVRTGWRTAEQRNDALAFVRNEVLKGGQAFVVCPVIDPSRERDSKAAKQVASELATGIFQGLRLELMHGRMRADERQAVMAAFQSGAIQVLVSTTVIEVGLDVPNASVVLVEHAERFGLSQLHQIRGRVGRGHRESFCILIAGGSDGLTPEALARLEAMRQTQDGFKIADLDLKIRGSGEIFGTRQAGLPAFRFADLTKDEPLIPHSRQEARRLLDSDRNLDRPEHRGLRLRSRALEQRDARLVEAG